MTPQACIVCDADAWEPLARGLARCRSCAFVRAAEIPTPEAIARLYAAEYFLGEEYADYLADEAAHVKNLRHRFRRITSIAGRIESVYEIGCAYGFWLRVAAEHGLRASGIDISPEAVRHARETFGQDAALGAFEDTDIPPGRFQAFCLWDTLEHLAHPEGVVAKIARSLAPGGWCFATTGDIGSALARREGSRWRMIHPPTHLQYFSRDTVSRFLARHGFEVVHIESAPVCRSLQGTVEGLRRFGAEPLRSTAAVVSRLAPGAILRRLRFTLDLGDIMLVCARIPRADRPLPGA